MSDEEKTRNQLAAELFAARMRAAGYPAEARKTLSIANVGPVRDGWVVNIRDDEAEAGIVATWWGRAHFQAYVEIFGHIERTEDAARGLALALQALRS